MQKVRLTIVFFLVFITLFVMKFNASRPKIMNGKAACVKIDDPSKFITTNGESIANVMQRFSMSEAFMHTEAFGADFAILVNWGAEHTATPEGQRLPEKEAIIDTIMQGYKEQCLIPPRWLSKVLEKLQIEEG